MPSVQTEIEGETSSQKNVDMRLFFAAVPGIQARQHIASCAAAVGLPVNARRISAENYHLTLAFAGEVTKRQATELRLIGASMRTAVFEVGFATCEHWPRSAVIVAPASSCPPALLDLNRQLRTQLDRLALAPDPHPFTPHVTLARNVSQPPVFKAMSPIRWRVDAFQLVQSSSTAAGSIYTVLDQWPLLDNAPTRKN